MAKNFKECITKLHVVKSTVSGRGQQQGHRRTVTLTQVQQVEHVGSQLLYLNIKNDVNSK